LFHRFLELDVNQQINPVRVEVNVVWRNAAQSASALLAGRENQGKLNRLAVTLHLVHEAERFDEVGNELAET
jgi:hypothetical protein